VVQVGGPPQWQVDAMGADGQLRWTMLLPAQLVASFTLTNGHIQRNPFTDCQHDSLAECAPPHSTPTMRGGSGGGALLSWEAGRVVPDGAGVSL
jgi:hypothetical protein